MALRAIIADRLALALPPAQKVNQRPAEKKVLMDRQGLAFDLICKTISELPTVSDAEVAKTVEAAKATNCSPDARPKYEEEIAVP